MEGGRGNSGCIIGDLGDGFPSLGSWLDVSRLWSSHERFGVGYLE
jgi:hypothetical protein